MKNILVTGGNGQLATCIKDISKDIVDQNFIYVDVEELDITKKGDIEDFFANNKITHCINCAAYTAVDKAESDEDLAKKINVVGARNVALVCSENKTTLIHISTDFVFNGKQTKLYSEGDDEQPLGIYGETKLLGEKEIETALNQYFIIRTSWLYSEHGHNFLKTMLRLGSEREKLSVVSDQIGTPTYAGDLAGLIVAIIQDESIDYGIYHYSNEGVASWYDFAKAIFDESKTEVMLFPINSTDYPTPAERPKFSVMDKTKVKKNFQIEIPYWRDSLVNALTKCKIANQLN